MYNNPYMYTRFIPNMYSSFPYSSILRNTTRNGLTRNLSGIISGIKKINWGQMFNNTSKTINVINQTIPLVRKTGPMINNIKSVMKVASIFKDETDTSPSKTKKNISQKEKYSISNNESPSINEYHNNQPVFFIN